ncbi:MAG: hypothetical protein N2252_05195 [Candidatus Kryptonium sp.]|nr:hypothetical protein [Candidatus Kryptonium sp.]
MKRFRFDGRTEQVLRKIFKTKEKSIERLEGLVDDFIKSTLNINLAEVFLQNFIIYLNISPNPEQSLNNFARFIENSFNKSSLYKDLAIYPQMLKILLTTFGYSQYLADIFVRDPELFRWITSTNALDKKPSKQDLLTEAKNLIANFQTLKNKLNALRRFKRKEILRIGVSDILGISSFEETLNFLSDLAEAIVEICLELAVEETRKKFSFFPETEFSIIALGKLGGKELNYSSDIDLIFIYNQDGEHKINGKVISYYEVFNALVSLLINFLSDKTEEGSLYRVDFRLRPEGTSGSLARSLLGYLTYYEVYGKLWERQMLIKARPIAGDLNFGWKFLNMLDSFIYPKSFSEDPTVEIAKIKAKLEATATSEYNIKLRSGGIRDIEFIVQTLQLLNAGKFPSLKIQNTLKAIEKLEDLGLLTKNEAKLLRENYIYFRRIEHLLQISHNTQTHTIQLDPHTLTTLAKAVKIYEYEKKGETLAFPSPSTPDWKIFKQDLDQRFEDVRKIYEKIFAIKTKPEILIPVDDETSQEKFKRILYDFSFKDPEKAMRNIEFLSRGKLITGEEVFSAIEENSFIKISSLILNEVSKTLIPDITLDNFRKIAQGFRYSKSFYDLLLNDSFRKIIINISQFSPRFSNLLSLKPYLLDALLSEDNLSTLKTTREIFEFFSRYVDFKIHDFKLLNEMRLLILNLDGFIAFSRLSEELTSQAELILQKIFHEIFNEEEKRKIAIIGLGKFGSEEMNYDSDIDVVFITDETNIEKYDSLTVKFEKLLEELTQIEIEKLYDVDVRLRPEGRNSPIVINLEYLNNYIQSRAQFWEIQALTRARFITGSYEISQKVFDLVYEKILKLEFTRSLADYIFEMRQKMEKNIKPDKIDIKLSSGALTDIEFIAQILQMRYLKNLGKIERNTPKALATLLKCGFIKPDEYQTLNLNYQFYREVEKFLRVSLGTKSNSIPDDPEKLEYLSLCMGYRFTEEFVDSLKSRMKKTREVFRNIVDRITRR